jgi:hypothetical protein
MIFERISYLNTHNQQRNHPHDSTRMEASEWQAKKWWVVRGGLSGEK